MYDWVPLLSTWNYHNSVNWLYGKTKQKEVNKNKSTQKSLKNSHGLISQLHSWCVLFYLSPTHFLLLNYLQAPDVLFHSEYFSIQYSLNKNCLVRNITTPLLSHLRKKWTTFNIIKYQWLLTGCLCCIPLSTKSLNVGTSSCILNSHLSLCSFPRWSHPITEL